MTIRDLLAHRTGMARHDPIWVYLDFPRSQVIPILAHLELAYGLRETFQYNNFMYTVAGIVIERVTGQSWENLIATSILKPLKMNDTNLSISELKLSSDFSLPYANINGSTAPVPYFDLTALCPAGGINSNVVDMTKWLQLQLSNGNSPHIIQLQLWQRC